MMSSRRIHLHTLTGIVLAVAAGTAIPSALPAQAVQGPQETPLVPDSDMRGIGPQLRRFQPTITPQPQPEPAPAPAETDAAPQPDAADTAAPARETPAERPAARPRQAQEQSPSTAVESDEAEPTRETAPAPAPSVAEEAPAANTLDQSVLPPVVEAAPDEAASSSNLSWLPYLAALLVGLGLGALLMRRRRKVELTERTEFQIVAEPAPVPLPAAPVPTPKPAETADAPSFLYRPTRAAPEADAAKPAAGDEPVAASQPQAGIVGIQIRPWLQLDFKPARAAATDVEATVQYELTVTNGGNEVARNVRIEARMFNAGAEQEEEIKRFFATPIPASTKNRILAIPARNSAQLRGVVSLPKEAVREIEINGRKLFIPTVAINVCYEWGNGRTGQTSMSYIVGREPETPSSKMGPFRLDLGPRIYRQVGHRPSQPELVV